MLYVWAFFIGLFLLVVLFVVAVKAIGVHNRRKAMEWRGYGVEGDPKIDPRSANEP